MNYYYIEFAKFPFMEMTRKFVVQAESKRFAIIIAESIDCDFKIEPLTFEHLKSSLCFFGGIAEL